MTGGAVFVYVRLEEWIAADYPFRAIRSLVNEALSGLSDRLDELYSHARRPSIAPEYLLRATLLQALFMVRSERQLMEQIDYNLLFRWFIRLSMEDVVWKLRLSPRTRTGDWRLMWRGSS
jgi:transposase